MFHVRSISVSLALLYFEFESSSTRVEKIEAERRMRKALIARGQDPQEVMKQELSKYWGSRCGDGWHVLG